MSTAMESPVAAREVRLSLDILVEAANAIDQRAPDRDHDGVRSMPVTVAMFNAWRDDTIASLTESDGWLFMALSKLAGARKNTRRRDDFEDAAIYLSHSGEASEREGESGYSMTPAVSMFNQWRGDHVGPLTANEGWVLMALIKLARIRRDHHRVEHYIDAAAYLSLAGESAELRQAALAILTKAAQSQ